MYENLLFEIVMNKSSAVAVIADRTDKRYCIATVR